MAQAPVIIPGAVVQLASGVVLDATLTTAQTVFTGPNGLKCIPYFVTFRDASATVNAAATVGMGQSSTATGGSSTQYLSASTVLQSMLTSTGPVVVPLYGSSVGTAKPLVPQGSNVQVTFAGTLTSNGFVKCDVYGVVEVA